MNNEIEDILGKDLVYIRYRLGETGISSIRRIVKCLDHRTGNVKPGYGCDLVVDGNSVDSKYVFSISGGIVNFIGLYQYGFQNVWSYCLPEDEDSMREALMELLSNAHIAAQNLLEEKELSLKVMAKHLKSWRNKK